MKKNKKEKKIIQEKRENKISRLNYKSNIYFNFLIILYILVIILFIYCEYIMKYII